MTQLRASSSDGSPFHAGEQEIQRRHGVRDRVEEVGRRIIRDVLLDQHREFYAQLPCLFLGSVDCEGQPWASVLTGAPGFVLSPDPKVLRVIARPSPGDPLSAALEVGADVGVVGIEFATRRRNRMNGVVSALTADSFDIGVTQSFGNCPKYIQAREWQIVPDHARAGGEAIARSFLDPADSALISHSDTFFIASAFGTARSDKSHGVDASHRGGKPGFVKVIDEHTLLVPDFVGNFAFNTLGNLLLESRCGLLFLDFTTGTTLQIAARAEIVWDGPEVIAIPGAERLVRFHIERVIRSENAVPLIWTFRDYSPFLPAPEAPQSSAMPSL
jgi:predicted pyridoxine 5'-phosphate oxidase superfamily flavin-nucleotide-binding protein